MRFYTTISPDENYTDCLMLKLSCFSRIVNGSENIFYKIWRNYLRDNDNILRVKPVKRITAMLSEDTTTTLNLYYTVLYSPDKLKRVNFNSRMNLFLKYY